MGCRAKASLRMLDFSKSVLKIDAHLDGMNRVEYTLCNTESNTNMPWQLGQAVWLQRKALGTVNWLIDWLINWLIWM